MLLINKQVIRILEIIILVFFIIGCANTDVSKPTASSSLNTSRQSQTGGKVAFSRGSDALEKYDYERAFKWFHMAAQQGHTEAQFNLGTLYYDGAGVVQNNKKAFKWFREAAAQGNAGAQHQLGFMYFNGEGVSKNNQKAATWFRKAAEQGYARAQVLLGAMYFQEAGVSKQEAVKWLMKAAAKGDRDAQILIELMFGLSEFSQLVTLIFESESMDSKKRKYWLDVLPILTPDQIAELRDILITEKRRLKEIETKN